MNKIISDLNWRYATKAFDSSKKISQEDLDTIIESFRLTASSFGLQPWKLFVIQDQDKKNQLLEHSWGQKQVVDASEVLVFARNDIDYKVLVQEYIDDMASKKGIEASQLDGFKNMMLGYLDRMSESEIQTWADKQIYIALGNIMTVLSELKIDSCAMEGFIPEKYDEILGLKEKGFSSVVVLPIGYRSSDDKYASGEKIRFSTEKISEII